VREVVKEGKVPPRETDKLTPERLFNGTEYMHPIPTTKATERYLFITGFGFQQ
jgi:hypothetical protein